ncbi:MAG: YceH family protein [Frankiaceae bacterium]|nr:YceH family protein [Frankiaceae bacterium]
MELTAEQGRVLGSLVEKELTTPQGYPLTDNALLTACNQTTSRDPVVQYDTATVRIAVRELRELGLLRTVHRPGERSDKHRHELAAALHLPPAQVALLGVLLLRGPQTPAELRARTERMHPFTTTEQAEDELVALMNRDEPLVVRLERQPGRKEARYAQLLTGAATSGAGVAVGVAVAPTSHTPPPAPLQAPAQVASVPLAARDGLDEVTALRAEVSALRAEVEALRSVVARRAAGDD